MNVFIKWIEDKVFEMHMKKAEQKISQMETSLIQYPLLVSLRFERDWYREQFDNGASVEDSVRDKAEEIARETIKGLTEGIKQYEEQE